MKTKFENLFEEIVKLFEMDSASVVGGSQHTGDYTIDYANKDARNPVGSKSINSIPDPNKKRKRKKTIKQTGMLMPIQRRSFPSVTESLIIKNKYDVFVQQTPSSSPVIVYRNVLAENEEDAVIQFLKYEKRKKGIKSKALPTYHYHKIWATKKEEETARLPYADN